MPLHRSLKWIKAGLIDETGAQRVDELRAYNPLLADLVVDDLTWVHVDPVVGEHRRAVTEQQLQVVTGDVGVN